MLNYWKKVKNYLDTGWRYRLRRNIINYPFDYFMGTLLACMITLMVLGIGLVVKICMEDNTGKIIKEPLDNPESSKWEKIDSTTWHHANSSNIKYSYTYRMSVSNGYLYRVVTVGYSNTTESIVFVPSNQLDTKIESKNQPW